MKWIITDTHFNHKNIIKYENRPENYGQLIIDNCKQMIKPDDELYHLGDVIFAQKGELKYIMSQIPGKKYLTPGNHDRDKKAQWFKDNGFDVVSKYIIIDNIMLAHHPKDIEPFKPMGVEYMIHGHFHRKSRKELDRTPEFYPFYKLDKYFNLSVEDMDYKPIPLYTFLQSKISEITSRNNL